MKRIVTDKRSPEVIRRIIENTGREYYEGEMQYKNLIFEMHTGQTANSVMSLVPLSESFINNEAQKILDIAKEMFPYKIYKGTEKEKENDAYIAFYNLNTPNSKRLFVQVKDLYNNDLQWFIRNVLSKISISNACMSFCTYYKKSTRETDIFSVNALVVDIDCSKAGYEGYVGHYKVEQQLFDNHFDIDLPAPTYIEEGNNMRLIYVLEEPLYIAKKKSFKSFIKIVMKRFAEKIDYLGSDKQKINSYVRIEGSANTKGWKWKPTAEVKWRKIGKKVDFDMLTYEFMPNIEEVKKKFSNYDKFKNLKNYEKKKTKRKKWSGDYCEHNQKVLEFLRGVQAFYNNIEDEGHREILCFLYRNFTYYITDDSEEAKRKMLEFNQQFNKPLPEKQVLSSTNNVNYRRYKYKNETLLRNLSIEDPALTSILCCGADRKEYQKNYYKKHRKTNKKLEKRRKTIKSVIIKMKSNAKKNVEVAAALAKRGIVLSIKSIEGYVTKFRKSGEIVVA